MTSDRIEPPIDSPECDGSRSCPALVHVHGCYRDDWRAECDAPHEHITRCEDL